MSVQAARSIFRAVVGIIVYTVLFAALHQISLQWRTTHFYSMWFPAGGVRFAALNLLGVRAAPVLAAAEVAGLAWAGGLEQFNGEKPLAIAGILSPCLAYGIALTITGRLKSNSLPLMASTVQFGAAAALAPMLAFGASLPWHIMGAEPGFSKSPTDILAKAVVFVVGDLLGILLVAPPILASADFMRKRSLPAFAPLSHWAGTAGLLALGGAVVVGIKFSGFGIHLVPLTLAVGAVGVLFGRAAAWIAVVIASAAVLWLTAGPALDVNELTLHLQLAGIVVVGFVAGSYSDDQRRMREELRRRDAALLQAERLKTLKGMSVAVIHELSQPLSTLSIETNYLAKLSKCPKTDPDELRSVSELIAQKTENLANMLRRLRSFGAASDQRNVVVGVEQLIRDVVAIIAVEARQAGVRIEMRLKKDLSVVGQQLELQQALTNLMRNAIAASPGGTVHVKADDNADFVRISVVNTPSADSPYRKGMGVGKLIVEAIAEMHGGTLLEHQSSSSERTMSLILPSSSTAGA